MVLASRTLGFCGDRGLDEARRRSPARVLAMSTIFSGEAHLSSHIVDILAGRSCAVDLGKEPAFGDDPALAGSGDARVLDRIL